MRFIAICALLLFTVHAEASDDVLKDCLRGSDSSQRLKACDSLIAAPKAKQDSRLRAQRTRGSLLAEAGRHAEAIDSFTTVIEALPKDAATYAQRGMAYLIDGKKAKAIADLSTAIGLDPTSYRFWLQRGYAYLTTNSIKKAVSDFDNALKIRPGSAIVLNNRGLAHRKSGDRKKAISDFSAAIKLNSLYALAYLNRGYVYEETGEKEKAISDFQAALRIAPKLQGATKGLARLGVADAKNKTDTLINDGRMLAQLHCGRCHAIDNSGASPLANAPAFRSLVSRYPLIDLRQPISRGIVAPHDKMPRFKLSDSEIDRIAAYVSSLK